jgi:hypothetical protein
MSWKEKGRAVERGMDCDCNWVWCAGKRHGWGRLVLRARDIPRQDAEAEAEAEAA